MDGWTDGRTKFLYESREKPPLRLILNILLVPALQISSGLEITLYDTIISCSKVPPYCASSSRVFNPNPTSAAIYLPGYLNSRAVLDVQQPIEVRQRCNQHCHNQILLNNLLPNSNNGLSTCLHCVHCLNRANRFSFLSIWTWNHFSLCSHHYNFH